jgi:oligopeptide/dipeptide ABC transporter ATP-binding protein
VSEVLLEVQDLKKHFKVRGGLLRKGGTVRAVDGVSFSIITGETFALVGESGCGKTTIAKMVLMLEAPTGGAIRFDGRNISKGTAADHKAYRRQAQAVFQDPYASLNPRLRVRTIIAEPLLAHGVGDSEAVAKRVKELLDIVGLPPAAGGLFPHEFSGGQRQRVAIARALALNPRFMVLDEPISALDVSIRAQILNLLADIQEEFALTYLIIAHDLALVEHFSTRVGVMYLGSMVETGPTAEVFARPSHPYTQALLASVPRPDPDHRPPLDMIRGEIASALAPPSGCKFHPRCPKAFAPCPVEIPAAHTTGQDHHAACHLLRT